MFRHYRVILRQPVIHTSPSYTSISIPVPCIFYSLYYDQQMHNNFPSYHTSTCFDTIVSSSESLQSIPCQVTPVFQYLYRAFLLFCTLSKQCKIISEIITPLHVSTLSCHPQRACNQYLAKLHQYFNTCTVHLLLFCTVTNKCTIISQIITLLHVSTLSVILRQPVINTLPSYTSISNAADDNTIYN